MGMFVEKSIEDGVMTWRINRPERVNALGTTLAKHIHDLLAPLHAELMTWLETGGTTPPVRALVLTATPTRRGRNPVWIGGGDLKELALLTEQEQGRSYANTLSNFCRMLEEIPIPVISAVNGAAIGGGAELALAADIRLATKISTFEFRQIRVGLATGYGGATRLVNLVGKSMAQRLLYFAETIDATKLETFGLVHRVAVDDADLLVLTKSILKEQLACEPRSFAAQKKMFQIATQNLGQAAYVAELEEFAKIWMNPSHKRFLERFQSADASINGT